MRRNVRVGVERDSAVEVARVGQPDLVGDRPGGPLLAEDREASGRSLVSAFAAGGVERAHDLAVLDQQCHPLRAVNLRSAPAELARRFGSYCVLERGECLRADDPVAGEAVPGLEREYR